jgi:25S rRNA (uracil2634-N3)-methyltransferase
VKMQIFLSTLLIIPYPKMPLSKLQQALLAQQSQAAYVAARKKSGTHKVQKEESLKHSQKEKKVLKKVRQARKPVQAEGEVEGEGDEMVVIDDSNRPSIDDVRREPKKKSKKTKQGTNPNQLPVVPFNSTDTILLLGEANFSYTLALIAEPHNIPVHQLLATSYDTERECYLKYPDGEGNVKKLRDAGVKVEFKVDAGNLEKCKAVGKGRWSRVIFNFPHAG